MRQSGITSVGEFHYLHHADDASSDNRFELDSLVANAAFDAGIRLVLLVTYYGYGGFAAKPLTPTQMRFETKSIKQYFEQIDSLIHWLDNSPNRNLCSVGVAAHSLRAVTPQDLLELHIGAKSRRIPFHMHIEEQSKEVSDCLTVHHKTPMRLFLDTVEVDNYTTVVHCNNSIDSELKEFVDAGGNVCICPLTEGNLGDGVIMNPKSCAEKICLGTDCNARIDFFEEMRWLEYSQRLYTISRGVYPKAFAMADSVGKTKNNCRSGETLLKMATENGARSLGLRVGKIAKSYFADFVSLDMTASVLNAHDLEALNDCLLEATIFGASASQVIKSTCVNGEWNT